jgi:molybdate transport system substrate-binding protein
MLLLKESEKINVKVTPRVKDATGMVGVGDADLTVMPLSEIVHAPGVVFAGSVAPETQFVQTFSAAVVVGSKQTFANPFQSSGADW